MIEIKFNDLPKDIQNAIKRYSYNKINGYIDEIHLGIVNHGYPDEKNIYKIYLVDKCIFTARELKILCECKSFDMLFKCTCEDLYYGEFCLQFNKEN